MSRPLILGISGAVIVGAALGLTYVVDSAQGPEIAAVLTTSDSGKDKSALGITRPVSPPALHESVLPSQGITVSPSQAVIVSPSQAVTVSPPRQTVVAPHRKNTISPTPRIIASLPTRKGQSAAIEAPKRPSFDVVRVSPRGDAVIAGRARPHATVVIRNGQKEVGTAKADRRGEWVVIPKQPLPKGSRELSLSAQNSDGTFLQSDRNVVVLVPEQTKQKIAPGGTSKVLGALAVLVPREGKGATVVIQRPGPVRPAPSNLPANTTGKAGSAVSIDSVDYDDAGNVTISGNSAPRTPLSVYIDNKHAASGVSDQQGRWRVVPGGELPPGDYTLRVDKVGEGGKVLGRAETQFTRAKPAKNLPTKTVVSVEPGNSLWRIARRVYGTGMQYSVIFDANREQIRDPDLIYPGQVFFVPHVN